MEAVQAKQFTAEEKVQLVHLYLSGEKNCAMIREEFGVHRERLRAWVDVYQSQGIKGFFKNNWATRYPQSLKEQVCREYLSGAVSLRMLCEKYEINDKGSIRYWLKSYNSHQHPILREIKREMTKGRKTSYEDRLRIVRECLAHENDYQACAQRHGVSYDQVYSWVRKYLKDGKAGLEDRRGRRNPVEAGSELERLRAEKKDLERENLRLQVQLAILKKLKEQRGGR